MSEWGAGYVDEIAYTYGYCDELDPLRLKLALLDAGLALPDVHTDCELGFGHGVSVNIHAAGSAVQWYGNDFNLVQVDFARQFAERAASRLELSAERFAEFCTRDDLPDFDYIGMHGIWSWISPENRAVIIDFIRRKLKRGGVLYLSYNAQPGWTAMLPVRELMHRHFQGSARPATDAATTDAATTDAVATEARSTAGAPVAPEEDVAARIAAAVAFAATVFAARPGYARANPQLAERVHALAGESTAYLAHEYFNRDWQPMPFGQVEALLAQAGLTYAASAHYLDHLDALNLTPQQTALVAGMPDLVLRETTRDFCVNRAFRRDYWIKDGTRLSLGEQHAAWRAQRVILALPRAAVRLTVTGALGEANLPAAIYEPILDALTGYLPQTLRHIETCVREHGMDLAHLVKAVMVLIGTGVLLNVQEEAAIAAARPVAARLNAAICERALRQSEVQFLVSPVSGSGIRVPRVPQLFLLARLSGGLAGGLQPASSVGAEPAQWAQFAHAALTASALADATDLSPVPELAALSAQAYRFAQVQLPILQALGIA